MMLFSEVNLPSLERASCRPRMCTPRWCIWASSLAVRFPPILPTSLLSSNSRVDSSASTLAVTAVKEMEVGFGGCRWDSGRQHCRSDGAKCTPRSSIAGGMQWLKEACISWSQAQLWSCSSSRNRWSICNLGGASGPGLLTECLASSSARSFQGWPVCPRTSWMEWWLADHLCKLRRSLASLGFDLQVVVPEATVLLSERSGLRTTLYWWKKVASSWACANAVNSAAMLSVDSAPSHAGSSEAIATWPQRHPRNLSSIPSVMITTMLHPAPLSPAEPSRKISVWWGVPAKSIGCRQRRS